MRSWLIGGEPIIPRGPLAFHVEALERHEDFMAEREQLAPEGGGLDAPVAQLRHRRAERIGELADEARNRGLRERQLLGRACHAAVAHARLECDELGKHAVAKIPSQSDASHGALHAVRQPSRVVLLEIDLGKRRGLCPERDEGRKQKDLCHAWQRSG